MEWGRFKFLFSCHKDVECRAPQFICDMEYHYKSTILEHIEKNRDAASPRLQSFLSNF